MNEEPQVLYCDAWLMAIDKPAGMIVHGDGTGERTLTDYASDLLLAMGDGFAATDMQPLNRLDRDTTGVVLFSLDKQTQPAFDQMVIDHAFEKHYLALAEGKIDWNEKLIDKPIARDRHDSRKMRVGASGKPSQTRVKVLKRLKSRRGLPRVRISMSSCSPAASIRFASTWPASVIPWLATTCTERRASAA